MPGTWWMFFHHTFIYFSLQPGEMGIIIILIYKAENSNSASKPTEMSGFELQSSDSSSSFQPFKFPLSIPLPLPYMLYAVCSVVANSAIPWTVVHQAPLSMEFSRQEYWSGLPFPSPPYMLYSIVSTMWVISSSVHGSKISS